MKGLAISTVGALILAIVALVFLWLFVGGGITLITQGLPQFMSQISSVVCSKAFGFVSFIFCR